MNKRKVPRRRGRETRGHEEQRAWWEGPRIGGKPWNHCCLHIRAEERRAGTGGTGIWGAELSHELPSGGRHAPRLGTPTQLLPQIPGNSPLPAMMGMVGGRGDSDPPRHKKEVLKCFFDNSTFLKLPILLVLPSPHLLGARARGGGHKAPRALSSSTTYHRSPQDISPPNRHTLTSTTQETFKNTKLTFRGKGVIG